MACHHKACHHKGTASSLADMVRLRAMDNSILSLVLRLSQRRLDLEGSSSSLMARELQMVVTSDWECRARCSRKDMPIRTLALVQLRLRQEGLEHHSKEASRREHSAHYRKLHSLLEDLAHHSKLRHQQEALEHHSKLCHNQEAMVCHHRPQADLAHHSRLRHQQEDLVCHQVDFMREDLVCHHKLHRQQEDSACHRKQQDRKLHNQPEYSESNNLDSSPLLRMLHNSKQHRQQEATRQRCREVTEPTQQEQPEVLVRLMQDRPLHHSLLRRMRRRKHPSTIGLLIMMTT